jgi:hypothetical protein
LLNTTSHDEENYDDPFQALVRYSVGATIDGAPMIFYGQELGISRTFGFDRYQINIGKTITHFMKFNSLQPILWPGNRNFGLDQIQPVYAGINAARQASRALRSSNRYFLNQTGGAVHATRSTPWPSMKRPMAHRTSMTWSSPSPTWIATTTNPARSTSTSRKARAIFSASNPAGFTT